MYHDEFEQFLQDEVKQHRMYPSDHIWKNIRTELHGYRAWPALTFMSLFIITALTISTLLNNHPGRQLPPQHRLAEAFNSQSAKHNPVLNSKPVKDYFRQIAPEQITAETFADLNTTVNPEQEIWVIRNRAEDPAAVPVKTGIQRNVYTAKTIRTAPGHTATIDPAILASSITLPVMTAIEEQSTENPETTTPVILPKQTDGHSSADEFLKDFTYIPTTNTSRRNSKFGIQFYITPSTSYRKLSDQKVKEVIQPAVAAASAAASQNVPLSPNLAADVNNVVRHKPAMGFELGFAVLYNMSPRLKFKTGVQLNIRQYYIETFQSLTNDLTSLSLINYSGIETINFYSSWNNNTGYRKTQLDNKVYQLSIPLGIQWDLIRGKRFGFNTEASIQPTMTLNNNTYLLSTDYKHYTGGGSFIRKWNINTSVGFSLTYTTGSSSWQLGPQIRYQYLPTYSNQYPIKEYLMDYGVRLGFTRQIK